MAHGSVHSGANHAPRSLGARLIGVFVSPRDTFAAVAGRPAWFGTLAVTAVLASIFGALPMTTAGGREAALDAQVQLMESFGMTVSDDRYAEMQRRLEGAAPQTAAITLAATPILSLVFSAILFVIFTLVLGGAASFRQVFAVVVHASVVSAAGQVFTGTINYARETTAGATNLYVLLPMLEEGSFAARVAGLVDLFVIWWLAVLAIGLAVLYGRSTQRVAAMLFSIYAGIALVAAAVMTGLGGA